MFNNKNIKPWEAEKYKYMPPEEEKETQTVPSAPEQNENNEQPEQSVNVNAQEVVAQEPTENFEAKSYSKRVYEKVTRLRERAKHFRLDVPRVNYELTKPKRPRVLYIILGIVCFIAAAALIGFSLFAGISSLPALIGVDTTASTGSWDIFHIISDLATGIANFFILFAILIIVAILVGFGFLIYYLIRSGLNCFDLSRATMEEIGYSPLINRSIYRLGITSAVVLAIYITLIVLTAQKGSNIAFSVGGIILLLIFIFLASIMTTTIVYKFKAQKWVKDNVSPEHQENYLAHVKALARVIRKNELRKSMENMGRW